MARRLTTFSKLLIVLLILAALFFGGQWVLNNTGIGQDLKDKAEQERTEEADNEERNSNTSESSSTKAKGSKSGGLFNKKSSGGSSDEDVLRVQLVTWPGYAPGLYFNEGAEANTRSRFFKDYGFKVEFTTENDLINAMNAWLADEYDVIVQTADAYPLYTSCLLYTSPSPRD